MNAPANLGREGGRIGRQLSLLPETPFSAQMPPPATLEAKLLRVLLTGQSLTHIQFLALTGSWRLAAYVLSLRAVGWPIESEDISAQAVGRAAHSIARYWLPQWVLQVAGGLNDD